MQDTIVAKVGEFVEALVLHLRRHHLQGVADRGEKQNDHQPMRAPETASEALRPVARRYAEIEASAMLGTAGRAAGCLAC